MDLTPLAYKYSELSGTSMSSRAISHVRIESVSTVQEIICASIIRADVMSDMSVSCIYTHRHSFIS
jgi:hypothetical protein